MRIRRKYDIALPQVVNEPILFYAIFNMGAVLSVKKTFSFSGKRYYIMMLDSIIINVKVIFV